MGGGDDDADEAPDFSLEKRDCSSESWEAPGPVLVVGDRAGTGGDVVLAREGMGGDVVPLPILKPGTCTPAAPSLLMAP